MRCEQQPASSCLTHVFNHAAAAVGLDLTEVALKNDGCEGRDMDYLAEFKRNNGFPVRGQSQGVLEAGKKAIDWDNKKHAPGGLKLPNGRMHGMSFTWTHEWDDGRGAACAGLMVQPDGTVNIVGIRADVGVTRRPRTARS